MFTTYTVSYDHQWEGQEYGTYSTYEKALEALKGMNVDVSNPRKYGEVTIFGSYRITAKVVY